MIDSPEKYKFVPEEEFVEDITASFEIRNNVRMFLLAGGTLAGHSDGDFSAVEQEYVATALKEALGVDEVFLNNIASPKEAIAQFEVAMSWIKENAADQREPLLRHLAMLVAVDDILEPDEIAFLEYAATGLGLEKSDAMQMVSTALFKKK